MFSPRPMQRIRLHCVSEEAPAAALALARAGVLHPEVEDAARNELPDSPGAEYQQLYHSARARLDKVLAHLGKEEAGFPSAAPRVVPLAELARVNDQLGELWRQCSEIQEKERRLGEEQQAVDLLNAALEEYAGLDVDLSLLQGHSRFLDLRIGSLPAAGLHRLEEAIGLAGYQLSVFRQLGPQVHTVVAGLQGGEKAQLDAVLASAGWRPLPLPEEFRDRPERLREELQTRRETIARERRALDRDVAERYRVCAADLSGAAQALRLAAPYAELGDALRGSGGLAVVQGWMPRAQVAPLQALLRRHLKRPFVLEARDPRPEELDRVPSVLDHPAWLRPFLALVKNYGVPRYGELDPTWLFAVSYVLMFGMMFGDVGHGALIAAAGAALHRKLRGFAPFVVAIGLSSALFGFLYGSIFGYEHVLPALWLAPLSDPARMLGYGLLWGAAFILLGCGLYVRNRLAEGNRGAALFDGRGLAGIALYLALLAAGYAFAAGDGIGWGHTLALLLPMAVILAYQWRHAAFPPGERVLVVLIEGMETVMAYVANTLSFLRVAAFALNHVALALAVFTLAEMMDAAGHSLMVVFGNLFILVLEGAIVAIQVLRLEYYEGFSRFFSGEGREFKPLTLK